MTLFSDLGTLESAGLIRVAKVEPDAVMLSWSVKAKDNCPNPNPGNFCAPNNLGSHSKNAAVGHDSKGTGRL